MAGQLPQRGSGSQNSSQHSVSDLGHEQADDEHARACSYVQEQLRAQLGGQRPVWDGPISGFWDHVDNQQNERTKINPEHGQPMHETSPAQFHAQEQFQASQQGGDRANRNVPAAGMRRMPGLFEHQYTQIRMPRPNAGQGQPATNMQQVPGLVGHKHTQNGMPGPNFEPGQPSRSAQGRNQYGFPPHQPGSQIHSPGTNQGGYNTNGHNSQTKGRLPPHR